MAMITDPNKIALARLCVLRSALGLEIKGMSRRGRSAYAIIKSELGFTGNKKRVYSQLNEYIQQKENEYGLGN